MTPDLTFSHPGRRCWVTRFRVHGVHGEISQPVKLATAVSDVPWDSTYFSLKKRAYVSQDCICVCVHVHVCVHDMCVCICTYRWVHAVRVCFCLCVRVCTWTCTCIRVCIPICTCLCLCMYISGSFTDLYYMHFHTFTVYTSSTCVRNRW